jgi:acetyl esterase/lipase
MRLLIAFFALIMTAGSALADERLDLELFMKHAEFSSMEISPGGDYLAATVPQGDRTGVTILDLRNYPQIGVMSSFALGESEHATGLNWVSDDRLVFTSNRQVGDLAQPRGTGRLWATNADGRRQMQIYGPRPGESIHARFAQMIHRLPDDPRRILVVEWGTGRERPHALLVDVDRYQRTSRVAISPLERGALAADQDGKVRFAFGNDEDMNQKFAWREDEDSDWQTFENPFGGDIEPWGATRDGKAFYVKSRDNDNMGVFRIELASGAIEPILVDDEVEALAPIWDAEYRELIGAVFNTGVPEARFIDPAHQTAHLWRSLQAALPNYMVIVRRFSDDQKRAVVNLYSDREPGVFMLLDVENLALNELAPVRSWVPAERMARVEPFRFEARDGMVLHGLLTIPSGVENPQDLPMVVEVHGGPHGPFDQWGWNFWNQAMASRGYLVLQVNFRGSGGYGYQFEHDAYGKWGAEMQDDVTDATQWAIEQGKAHPDRICISGGSYGGYSALMGVIREPELYRCAFAFVGVYDLELSKEVGNIPETEIGRRYLDRALGTDPVVLRERSPVHHVENIKADLFIAHGAEDRQAHYDNYHALIAALEKAGIAHQKLWVEGEGHGFYEVDNRVKVYGQALDFFDAAIGSGWTPRDPDANGDSAQTAGIEY